MAKARRVEVAEVVLWGRVVGAVAWQEDRGVATFEYDPEFRRSGLEVAPLVMPLAREGFFSFPELPRATFKGLPGMLADALPDRFGNALIDLWLRRRGRSTEDFSSVERLCYMGSRAMGALEFRPSTAPRARVAVPMEVADMAELVAEILRSRGALAANLAKDKAEALQTIIRVGTSAGGARAKAVIALNPRTGEVRSGQLDMPPGFEPWLLKFDGVVQDDLGDPRGFGLLEYAYHRMAAAAGVRMAPCRLLRENGRAHFLTRRFDRTAGNERLHMQSLCGLAHLDFNAPGACGYEDAFAVLRRLNLGHDAARELYRRMVFNVVARNQDDHTRNVSFLMDARGAWTLAPAYDMVWSYRPDSRWVARHQMSVNGRTDDFARDDLLAVARSAGIRDAAAILREVAETVARWMEFASESGVDEKLAEEVGKSHRLGLEPGVERARM